MMTTDAFFDSNVLVYFFAADPGKAQRSERLLAAGGLISVQVLNECVLVMLRKFGASWSQIQDMSDKLRSVCGLVPVTEAVHVRGIEIARRHNLHVYDAMVVAAAVLAGCATLYSEDTHNGLIIDGLTIRNPYVAG
jgi:predicted nucleic acid-binding protein